MNDSRDDDSSIYENKYNIVREDDYLGDLDEPTLNEKKKLDELKKNEKIKTLLRKRKRKIKAKDIDNSKNRNNVHNSYYSYLSESNNYFPSKKEEANDKEKEKSTKKKEDNFNPNQYNEKCRNNIHQSLEDLNLFKNNKKSKNTREIKIVEESYISDHKNHINNELLKNILKNEILDINQKEELNKLISEIKNKNIKDIVKKNKLDIIFDLDNTCILGLIVKPKTIKELKEQFPQKELKSFSFLYQNKNLRSGLIIRKGLSEFLKYSNSFCNFYIRILGVESYGLQIMSILEKLNNIKFKKFIGRKNENERRKFIKDIDINLDKKKTLIFDDKPSLWVEDYLNVILSKKFSDKECEKLSTNSIGSNIDDSLSFLYNYYPFYYYKSKKNNYEQIEWRNQKLIGDRIPPFYKFNDKNDTLNNNCYSGEYLESSRYQFIYMKDIIKIVYYFVFYFDINVPDAIKLIRYNIFYNRYFCLEFYKGEKIILKDIIENCGGQIFDENKQNKNNAKIFYICKKDDYSSLKDKIKKELIYCKESKVVTEKYILDSFYFMTNLEDEINDSEYSCDN